MKTQIIIQKGWKIIKEYDFLITLNNDDTVCDDQGVEYRVIDNLLDLETDTMKIMVR